MKTFAFAVAVAALVTAVAGCDKDGGKPAAPAASGTPAASATPAATVSGKAGSGW